MRAAAVGLCALYLRGAPGGAAPRCAWGRALGAMRRAEGPGGLALALRRAGLCDHAGLLDEPGRLDWALELLHSHRALTAECPGYPARWLDALGAGAPPALWVLGEPPSGPLVGFAGSREPNRAVARFVRSSAARAMARGYAVCTGGARGVDRIAAASARRVGTGRALVVLPYGLAHARASEGVCLVSPSEPRAEFTTAQAMERNALIYAAGEFALAAGPRFMRGGTWHGAAGALRRRLTAVCVYGGEPQAVLALSALGAHRVASPGFVGAPPPAPQPEPSLFGEGLVCEPDHRYSAA